MATLEETWACWYGVPDLVVMQTRTQTRTRVLLDLDPKPNVRSN